MLYINTGKIIRDIRLNKNIASKDLYIDLLSRPAIAKFEKGLSDTTVEKFFIILERLNITLEEFEILFKEQKNDYLLYTRLYSEAFYNRDICMLKKIAEHAEMDYQATSNIRYTHYKAITLLLIDDINKSDKYIDEVEVLKNYIMNCQSWGYYEITLFANSISFYSNELIDMVYKRAKDTLTTYHHLRRYRNELALTLFNIVERKIIDKDLTSAQYYMKELGLIEKSVVDNMYVQTIIKFFTEVIVLLLGDLSRHSVINKIIESFSFLELENKAIQLTELYQRILDTYEIKNIL